MEENEVTNANNNEQKSGGKGLGIASLVLGILSLVFLCVWYISIPCGILAIIFGIVSKKSSENGMATAGLVTGIIGTVVSIAFLLLLAIGIMGTAETIVDMQDSYYYNYNL